MAAQDKFHTAVKRALIKEGWTITHDPLPLSFGDVNMFVDLGAEKLIAAQKDETKIAVEIKSFLAISHITEFHTAVGQYINYRTALQKKEPNRTLFLAVPDDVYIDFFRLLFVQTVIEENQLRLIVYDGESEVVVQWRI